MPATNALRQIPAGTKPLSGRHAIDRLEEEESVVTGKTWEQRPTKPTEPVTVFVIAPVVFAVHVLGPGVP